jgi:hypothetical protein
MGNQFISKQIADSVATLTFSGSPADLANKVHEFFISRNYKLKSGSPESGLYEYGNYLMRILFGAFVKYFKFQTFVIPQGEQTVIRVQKGHSGMSGGVIGMAKLNKELKRIAEAMEGLGHDLGMYGGR